LHTNPFLYLLIKNFAYIDKSHDSGCHAIMWMQRLAQLKTLKN
jgi:hypothetical protein